MFPLGVCWLGSLLCRLAASAPHWGPSHGPPRGPHSVAAGAPGPQDPRGKKTGEPQGFHAPTPNGRRQEEAPPPARPKVPVQRLKALLWKASTWLPRPYMNRALNSKSSIYPGRTSSFISISWFESKRKSLQNNYSCKMGADTSSTKLEIK